MAAAQQFLALDLGAESGRGILAQFDGERLGLTEVRRFATGRGSDDIGGDGVRRWEFERIWTEIEATVQAAQQAEPLAGIGVDSWGVDFGLLDAAGGLLEPPLHYRNDANTAAAAHAHQLVARDEIWEATGIQCLPFNTLYQLVAIQQRRPELLDQAKRLLLIPDLIHYRLTAGGSAVVERTNASTTQMLSPQTRDWDRALLSRLGLPSQFLGELVEAGTWVGQTPGGIPVYAPGTHDTASAVAAVPSDGGARWAFLSSGTWSLLGVSRPTPELSLEAQRLGLSNEGGVGGSVRLLKNIMGLWLVQECRRSLQRSAGHDYSYETLTARAAAAAPGGPLIDAADGRFLCPPDMAEEIRAACRETGQPEPGDVGALMRCCLESLALAYRRTLRDLERLLGERLDVLHIVGGGSQNAVLNQWTADACGVPVIAGPAEATAVGNVLGQLMGAGLISSWAEAREVSRRSFPGTICRPDASTRDSWDARDAQVEALQRG